MTPAAPDEPGPDDEVDAPLVRVVSLGRPWAGALAKGPCRIVSMPAFDFVLPPSGILLAIHADARWAREEDVALVVDLWPDCPRDEAAHPQGLVAVALLERVEWVPANGPAGEDLWAFGPWALVLRDLVAIEPPILIPVPRSRELANPKIEDALVDLWEARPL